jgi:hypothetical protein
LREMRMKVGPSIVSAAARACRVSGPSDGTITVRFGSARSAAKSATVWWLAPSNESDSPA